RKKLPQSEPESAAVGTAGPVASWPVVGFVPGRHPVRAQVAGERHQPRPRCRCNVWWSDGEPATLVGNGPAANEQSVPREQPTDSPGAGTVGGGRQSAQSILSMERLWPPGRKRQPAADSAALELPAAGRAPGDEPPAARAAQPRGAEYGPCEPPEPAAKSQPSAGGGVS